MMQQDLSRSSLSLPQTQKTPHKTRKHPDSANLRQGWPNKKTTRM